MKANEVRQLNFSFRKKYLLAGIDPMNFVVSNIVATLHSPNKKSTGTVGPSYTTRVT